MTEWEFDVAVSSHDWLRVGVAVHHYRRVTVAAPTYSEAALTALEMAALDGAMPTDILFRL